ncbi:MAG: hypothetical protein ABWY25_04125 [Paenisporosarcina sp.]
MTLEITIMVIGIGLIVLSYIMKSPVKRLEKEIQDLSIDYYQDVNQLKRRIRVVEEELMIDPNLSIKSSKPQKKPIHEILVNQVLALHQQGYNDEEISKRSALSIEQVRSVIGGNR